MPLSSRSRPSPASISRSKTSSTRSNSQPSRREARGGPRSLQHGTQRTPERLRRGRSGWLGGRGGRQRSSGTSSLVWRSERSASSWGPCPRRSVPATTRPSGFPRQTRRGSSTSLIARAITARRSCSSSGRHRSRLALPVRQHRLLLRPVRQEVAPLPCSRGPHQLRLAVRPRPRPTHLAWSQRSRD